VVYPDFAHRCTPDWDNAPPQRRRYCPALNERGTRVQPPNVEILSGQLMKSFPRCQLGIADCGLRIADCWNCGVRNSDCGLPGGYSSLRESTAACGGAVMCLLCSSKSLTIFFLNYHTFRCRGVRFLGCFGRRLFKHSGAASGATSSFPLEAFMRTSATAAIL